MIQIPDGDYSDAKPFTDAKPKRKRKDWVYKSDYDKLDRKYKIVKRITLILLIALVIALRF